MNSSSPFLAGAQLACLAEKIAALELQLRGTGLGGGADVDGHIRELLGFVFEALPHFVAILDPNGTLLYLNSVGCRLAGFASAEGHAVAELFSAEASRAFLQDCLPHAQRHGIWQGESMWRARDGRELTFAQIVMSHRDSAGGLRFISLIARDVTHRRATEEILREQAALLEKAHEAVVVRDLEGRVLRWSAGATRLYGWSAAEAAGRPAAELLGVDPESYRTAIATTMSAGNWNGELTKHAKGGVTLVIDSRWTLIRDAAGKPTSVLSIDADITEQRRLEKQMLRAQRMESIGALAGGVAHDLNNVLAPIVMGVGLMQSKTTDPEILSVLETMERSAARGVDLVRQVLSFARGVEGRRGPISPQTLVRDLRKIMTETFPKSVMVTTTVAPDVGDVLGDMTQLHQVLLNLVVNARDAMPQGGQLILEAHNEMLDESYAAMHPEARTGLHVVFRVADSGTGIPPEIIDKIFDPFFTTKEAGRGTGLGLSTAYAIVKGYGGFINVYSEVGKGTDIRVYFPAQKAGQRSEVETITRDLPRGRGERVLVVDDEESISSVVVRTLERHGYRATAVRNGAEALAAFVQRQPAFDVVLTDMAMPVMDGLATIVALRTLDPQVRIIAASGLGSNEKFVHVVNAGVQHFLQKPFTAEALLRTMQAILETPSK